MWQPQGIAVDTSVTPNVLYVADYLNNRVLGWKDAQSFRNGQMADIVIGQADFYRTTPGGPGTSFTTGLNSPMGLAVDTNGNLYVADQLNNRVLRFPRPTAQRGEQFPDMVIGQPNFTTNTRGVSEQNLSFSNSAFINGLALDPQGNLWVVDGGNRRVLRFAATDLASSVNGPKANLVLGQENFTTVRANVTSSNRTTANVFAAPGGIAFDSRGRLYVTDMLPDLSVSRVLVFLPEFSTNQSAARIMGIYTGSDPEIAGKIAMRAPSAVFFPGNRIGVVDGFSNRILMFDSFENWPDSATMFSPQAIGVFGQSNFTTRTANAASAGFLPAPSASTMAGPLAAVFAGSELFLADTANNRVLALPLLSSGSNFGPAVRVLGQYGYSTSGANLVEERGLNLRPAPNVADAGVALDESGDVPHLYVADTYNNRILGYRDFRKVKAGAPNDKADIVIGQPDYWMNLENTSGNPDGLTASSLRLPTGLIVDSKGDLWVADTGNGRVLRFPAPFARQNQPQVADVVIGQRNFTSKITDPSRSTLSQPYGLAMTQAGLLVSDIAHNRVLLFEFGGNNSFSATDNGKAAAKVFGQPDFLTISSGNGQDKMSSPHHIGADNEGRLYVADSGNNRVMIFSELNDATSAGARATMLLTGLAQPRGIFVNQMTGEFWVAEANSGNIRRYPRYGNLILNPASIFTAQAASSTLAVAQDQYGDLVVADSTSRIGFYYPAMHPVNGGSFLASRNFLAPGMLASLCAPNSACNRGAALFGPDTEVIPSFPMPRTLADTQVLFNGEPAPLYAVTPTQINFVVPMKAPTSGFADIQVVQQSTGRIFAATTVAMNTVSPAILMQTFDGQNRQAAVINQDGTVNSPSNPAKRGSYIQIYATGQGFVPEAAEIDGEVVSGDFRSRGNLRVNINGAYLEDFIANPADRPKSEWLYAAGLSQYPGLWYINVWVPSGVLANKEVPILLLYNNVTSSDGSFRTTISVQ
jgi:uncharacterized protein (TIGR03437 family)